MQGETEKRKRRRRKKKSKFGYYLYAVVILVLTITNITLAFLLLTHVQGIHVTGNVNSQKSAIVSWIKEDPLTVNSLYTLWKFKSGSYTLPVYLEGVDVSLGAPWKVNVEVKEKQIIGCIIEEEAYVYFDAEGLVLRKTTFYDENVPVIEGIEVKNTRQFEKMEIDNEKIFSYIVSVTKEIEDNNLSPDRLAWEDNSMTLYFKGICVKLGKSNYDIKLKQLPNILKLKELEGKKGTLRMEHYTSDSKNFSFEKSAEES